VSAQTITETALGNPNLTKLVEALTASPGGLVAVLNGTGPFTVFAPIDSGFNAAPVPGLALSGSNLYSTLTYHVVSGTYNAAAVLAAGSLKTLNGDNITFSTFPPNNNYVNSYSKITQADIICSNGIVHLVDSVIEAKVTSLLNVTVTTPILSTLLTLAAGQGLGPTLSNVATKNALTVIAPNNTAFATLNTSKPLFYDWLTNARNIGNLTSVLTYHVIPSGVYAYQLVNGQNVDTVNGQTLKVNLTGGVKFQDAKGNAATVTIANVAAYNGVAHVVDTVLIPTTPYDSLKDILTTAVSAGLTQLAGALTTAGLISNLSSTKGPFTVFAPVDPAFTKYPVGSLTGPDLVRTLTYHVIPSRIYSSALAASQTVTTLSGDKLTITKDANGVRINGYATVTTADVDCTNGVVHLIDTVIEAPQMTLATVATSTGSTGDFALSSLLTFVASAGLTSSFTNPNSALTLFAPTNSAFVAFHKTNVGSWYTNPKWSAQVPTLLLNHVVNATAFSFSLTNGQKLDTLAKAGQLTVSTTGGVSITDQRGTKATVTYANIPSYKGVAHIVDSVLVPNAPAAYPKNDIVANAVATTDLSVLVQKLTDANLVSALTDANGPYTVLAPVNQAFTNAQTTLASLTAPQVATVLKYHVIKYDASANGRIYSTDLVNGGNYTTLDGYTITCVINGNTTTFVSSAGTVATVLTADVDSTNGVVHIIDTVLVPSGVLPTPTPKPNGAAATGSSILALLIALIAAAVSAF
jgi:transforming growth factor-beta-induced protein